MTIQLTEDQIDDVLFYARTGQLEDLQKCVEELSEARSTPQVDIIASSLEEQSQNTPLHMAAANGQLGTLNYVVKLISTHSKGSILDAQNAWGNTPLHWAALNGHLEAVKALLAAGATAGIKNEAGHDAVYEAEMNSKNSVVEWLLQQDQGHQSHFEGAQESISPDDEKESETPNDEPGLVDDNNNIHSKPSP